MAGLYLSAGRGGSCRRKSEIRTGREPNAPALDFFERLGCGCVVIDGVGHVLEINEYAERYIGRELALRQGRLAATDPGCDADLQRLIGAALGAAPQNGASPAAAVIHRDTGHPLVACAASVDGPVPPAYAGARAVVTIVDLDDSAESPLPSVLQAAFRLTPAEARVAQGIACGYSPEQIAERQNTSPGTVREQLKAVFQKTNTHRQSQLVSLLARLGRLSRWHES